MNTSKLLSWIRSIRRWFRRLNLRRPSAVSEAWNTHPKIEFRKLERRRVYAVDAFFSSGALSIEISGNTANQANLLSDGTEFFVDENNDLLYDPTELRGLVSDIESITVVLLGRRLLCGTAVKSPNG
jgi:hypothetical protein